MKKITICFLTLLACLMHSMIVLSEELELTSDDSEPSAKAKYFYVKMQDTKDWLAEQLDQDSVSPEVLVGAREIVKCHVEGMSQLSEYYQNIAYTVVADGGTTDEAMETLGNALKKAIGAGGDEAQKVREMRNQSSKTEMACLKEVPGLGFE